MLSKGNNNFHRGIKSVRIAVCELGVEIAALPFLYCKYSIQETPLFLVISHEWIPFFDFFNISRKERIRAPYRIWGLCLLMASVRSATVHFSRLQTWHGLRLFELARRVLISVSHLLMHLSFLLCLIFSLSPISWCAAERHNYPLHLSHRDNGWPSPLGEIGSSNCEWCNECGIVSVLGDTIRIDPLLTSTPTTSETPPSTNPQCTPTAPQPFRFSDN